MVDVSTSFGIRTCWDHVFREVRNAVFVSEVPPRVKILVADSSFTSSFSGAVGLSDKSIFWDQLFDAISPDVVRGAMTPFLGEWDFWIGECKMFSKYICHTELILKLRYVSFG